MASPPGNGGRGLKPLAAGGIHACRTIAPRQRGAWIETDQRTSRSGDALHRPPATGGVD